MGGEEGIPEAVAAVSAPPKVAIKRDIIISASSGRRDISAHGSKDGGVVEAGGSTETTQSARGSTAAARSVTREGDACVGGEEGVDRKLVSRRAINSSRPLRIVVTAFIRSVTSIGFSKASGVGGVCKGIGAANVTVGSVAVTGGVSIRTAFDGAVAVWALAMANVALARVSSAANGESGIQEGHSGRDPR